MESCFCRLRFLGKVLKVEKASKTPNSDDNKSNSRTYLGTHEAKLSKDLISPTSTSSFSKDIGAEQVSRSRSLPAAELIAPRLGVDYPFPPHLEYVAFFTYFLLYKSHTRICLCICGFSGSTLALELFLFTPRE